MKRHCLARRLDCFASYELSGKKKGPDVGLGWVTSSSLVSEVVVGELAHSDAAGRGYTNKQIHAHMTSSYPAHPRDIYFLLQFLGIHF